MLHIQNLSLPSINLSLKKFQVSVVILLTSVCLLLFIGTRAQITIKGSVHSANDRTAVPFITIVEKGKKIATSADVDGNFSITIMKLPARLVFSAVGFSTKEIKVKDSSFLPVTIEEASSNLSEVVVVGYGREGETDDYSTSLASSSKADMGVTTASGLKRTARAASTAVAASSIRIRGLASVDAKDVKEHSPLPYEHSEKGTFVTDSLAITTADKPLKKISLLTAGEVNDFKKWKMWEDYNETDFKIHSEKWNLFATQRYSVQLQNNNYKAVVGETVYLINKETKEIIWTSVSDNTGKAELWSGFSKNNKDQNLVIEVKNETKQFSAIPFSQGINHIQLNRSCTVSNKVEIAFVVDATGSMGDEIEYLKDELGDILTKISLKDPTLDLNTSAVFYRDKTDDYVTRSQPFTKGISSTIEFIKKQSAGGGGDYPEALKEALEEATDKLLWSAEARTKIIFLLMDAPPHDEEKNEMAVLIANAAAKGIRIVPVACSGTDKATEFIMRSMALATNGTYLFLTDDSGIGGAHIKPTTDEFKVELLNDLLQRIIEQMCFVNTCEDKKKTEEPFSIYANKEKVKVFPNPTQGLVTIETDKELKEIFVADFTGKILMRLVVSDEKKQYKINLSSFPSATYFIRYITKENKTGAEKVVLLH